MGLFERLASSSERAAKIINGRHPEGQIAPKADPLPIDGDDDTTRPGCKRNVLVALSGDALDCELVSLACLIAKQKKMARLYAIYGIEVPRTLAIDEEMVEETARAEQALAQATGLADQLHMQVEPEIVQSRNFGQSLVDEARAHECSLLVLGLPYHVGVGGHFEYDNVADYVLQNAPCRVWLVRGQRPSAQTGERGGRPEMVSATR